MLLTAIKAVLGIVTILGGWVLVQLAWRRVFPGTPPGDDILAGRIGCHNCTCSSPCEFAEQNNDHDNANFSTAAITTKGP